MDIKLNKFIKIRIAEPLTSIEINKNFLVFGSISGYVGIYDLKNNCLNYFEEIYDELIRNILVLENRCFINIGDLGLLVLDILDNANYKFNYLDFKKKHNNLFCCSSFSFTTINKSYSFFFPTFENFKKYQELTDKPSNICINFDKNIELKKFNENSEITKINNFKPLLSSILMDYCNDFFIFIEYFN